MSTGSEQDHALETLIKDAIDRRLAETHCNTVARIKDWDEAKQLAQVEVCLNPTLLHDDGEELVVVGVIHNVPIEFPSGGGYFMSFPLAAGDPVKLSFHDHSLDLWLERGGVVDVKDLRNHHISDASAFPGLCAKPNALNGVSKSKLVIGKSGDPSMQITIDGSTIKLSDNATHSVALANLASQWAAVVDAILTGPSINEPGSGSPSALQLALKTALAGLGGPRIVPAPSESTWGASKVKAE